MSEDLIRRSDAIKHCEVWRDRAKEHKDRDGWWMADNLLGLIKDIPTIEPKRGEWVPIHNGYHFRCSECGRVGHESNNYCPNCGADMRGAD